MDEPRRLRIGELAALADVSTRTIRHYHHVGLLPEPDRAANGYRVYGLHDLVLLLRARRLAEVGLRLDEITDVLGERRGQDVQEILADLDADLRRQEEAIAQRRRRIAILREADLTGDREAVLTELEHLAGSDHPAIGRERRVAELLEVSVDPETTGQIWQTYRDVLGDDELAGALLELGRRFEELRGLEPRDPRVDEIAAAAGGLGPAVAALTPEASPDDSGEAAERLIAAMETDLDPAQRRCLRMMTAQWKEQQG